MTALSSLPERGRRAACVASHKLDRVNTLFLFSKHKSYLTAGCQGNARAIHYCSQCSPEGRGREKLSVAWQSWEEVAQIAPCGWGVLLLHHPAFLGMLGQSALGRALAGRDQPALLVAESPTCGHLTESQPSTCCDSTWL